MKFGQVELENFIGLTRLPQGYASAWSALETGDIVEDEPTLKNALTGAGYKALVCYGKQRVNGMNYIFIAEQTLMTYPMVRRVVKLTINEHEGKYKLVDAEEI